ncbi:MAG: winged helix-turn-helix transcriptional regulator [Nitrospira sp.]
MSLRLVHGRINDARRFSELLADIPGVSPKVFLSQLQRLEQDGVLTRHVMATSPPTVEYALTHLGHELTPAIEAIVQVGHKLKRRSMP